MGKRKHNVKSLLRWLTSSWRKGFLLPWKSWKQLQNKETTGLQIKISTASCVSWIRILLNNAKKQARPADWSVSMPSCLCRTVFSNYLFYFICTQNLRSKSLLLAKCLWKSSGCDGVQYWVCCCLYAVRINSASCV